mmetsp:Transcript_3591/g.8616  ORF Transcript_3591/g.8616 Transcript_3591/m.8616 type:complete len:1054 (-) Transcript_3591:195-3356(-)
MVVFRDIDSSGNSGGGGSGGSISGSTRTDPTNSSSSGSGSSIHSSSGSRTSSPVLPRTTAKPLKAMDAAASPPGPLEGGGAATTEVKHDTSQRQQQPLARLPSALKRRGSALSSTGTSVAAAQGGSGTSASVSCGSRGGVSTTGPLGGGGGGGGGCGRNSTGSMSGDTKSTSKAHRRVLEPARTVFYGRYIFILLLAVAAAVLGYLAYRLMSDAENQIASERFESITERALSTAQLVIEEKKKATDSLALMVGTANPNADAWPNVYMEGYEEIATSLRVITEGSLSFCPIVVPGGEEQQSFEEFAYDLFYNVMDYPNTTGVSAFGRGVFSYGSGENGDQEWPDGRFHIQSGWTYHRISDEIIVPFLQSDYGSHSALMLNVHFEHNRAAAIDETIRCSRERAKQNTEDGDDMECGSITDLMWSETAADVDPGPAGLMMVPIYPRNNNKNLTGFIVGKQIWSDLLKHGFENDVNGLDIVLRTDAGTAHTYRIQGGEAIYISPDDTHDPNARFSIVGTHINPRFFSNSTRKYYLDIYSTNEFAQSYSTTNPTIACVGSILIIIFTSAMFFLFDFFVRRDFHDKKKLLDAKRQFVRYISHECRTPLNSVCMGLKLLTHELASSIGVRPQSALDGANRTTQITAKRTKESLQPVDEANIQEWISLCNQIFENADEAVTVLSDLLNYDKIQMGTLSLELSVISPWAIIEKSVSEFKLSACEKGVTINLDFSPLRNDVGDRKDIESPPGSFIPTELAFCKIVADNVRITQVLRNLLSNGIKFSKERGVLTVRVTVVPFASRKRKEEKFVLHNKEEEVTLVRHGWLVVEVIDDGVGMNEEQVVSVFDDGTQFGANKNQAGGGSGLGLNIARGIAQEHKGKLTCSSFGLGLGSTFCLSLPLFDPPGEVDPNLPPYLTTTKELDSSGEGEVNCTEFVIPNLKILVVDDALTNRKLCIRLLERCGHVCDGAADGIEAVEMVKKSLEEDQQYDCILLDYEMPNLNGPEACQKMRKLGCSSYISGLTGNLMTEDVNFFRACGANAVLPKPFRLEALEEQLIEDGLF